MVVFEHTLHSGTTSHYSQIKKAKNSLQTHKHYSELISMIITLFEDITYLTNKDKKTPLYHLPGTFLDEYTRAASVRV